MRDLLDKISELRVLVIGDIMLDHYIIGDVARISPEAPVPVVAVEGDKYALGAAANVALNVARLGCDVEIIGAIGKDGAGEIVKNLLGADRIMFDRQFEFASAETITKVRVLARGQQLCRIDRDGKKSYYEIKSDGAIGEICEKIMAADAVILSDYAKGIFTNYNVAKFITAARNGNSFISIDPKPSNRLQFSGVSLVTPNKAEAAQLAGMDFDTHGEFPASEICAKISEKFSPKNLVITLGADGMLIAGGGSGERILQIPTYAKEVFDVSGAGDTSIACLTLALAVGESLVRAAKFANVAAGVVVSKRGTAPISVDGLMNCESRLLLNL
ncbi:MAG: PfkB family carbohydrate kinase [Puniceicoccales bacterium]|jgi:D-beta-D-heptose 7-phosphate kinase/D-beta-D-heptose 1-phosphate adenosyltransferase|nr:PfkB family carbohydrate kinase [Puniceicoccales bacterium]